MDGAQPVGCDGAGEEGGGMGVPAARGSGRDLIATGGAGGIAKNYRGPLQVVAVELAVAFRVGGFAEESGDVGAVGEGGRDLVGEGGAAAPPLRLLRLIVGDEGLPGLELRRVHLGEKSEHAVHRRAERGGEGRVAGVEHILPDAGDEIGAVVGQHPAVQEAGRGEVAEIFYARVHMPAGEQGDSGEAAVGVRAGREHLQAAAGEGGFTKQVMGAQELHAVVADPEHAVALHAVLVEALQAEPDGPAADRPGFVQQRVGTGKGSAVGDRGVLEHHLRAAEPERAGAVDDQGDKAKGAPAGMPHGLRPGRQLEDVARLVVPVIRRKRVLEEQGLLQVLAIDELEPGGVVGVGHELEHPDELLAEIEHEQGGGGARGEHGFPAAQAGFGLEHAAGPGDGAGWKRRINQGRWRGDGDHGDGGGGSSE